MVPHSLKLPQASRVPYKLTLIMKHTAAFEKEHVPFHLSTAATGLPVMTPVPVGPVPFSCSGFWNNPMNHMSQDTEL